MTKSKSKTVEIVFVLDMTGSMQPLASETVIGFNNFLVEQKKVPGKANITLITFNSYKTKKLLDKVDLTKVDSINHSDYRPDGLTPLLDTIGNVIDEFKGIKNKVIFAIMTDGEENFSRKYNRKQIFDLVAEQRDKHKWEFIFLGANQDSYLEAGRLGIDPKDITNYDATAMGTRTAYSNLSASVTSYRH